MGGALRKRRSRFTWPMSWIGELDDAAEVAALGSVLANAISRVRAVRAETPKVIAGLFYPLLSGMATISFSNLSFR